MNTRPTTTTGLITALLLAAISLASAALGIKDIWRGRAGLHSLWPALAGAGLALFAGYTSLALSAFQQSGYRQFLSANNLKQLASALLEYEKDHGRLPPAAVHGRHGEALLSWRVFILPYLEQDDLFKQFKLDEPWDSPTNLPLLDKMPRVFAPPAGAPTPGAATTYYQVFVGPGAAFENGQGVTLADFPDGVDNTFLVVEAGEAVPWTKPQDLPYGSDKPLPKLGGIFRSGFWAFFADAHGEFVREEVSEATVRALITRNGGDTPGSDR